jgi:hypothetical protein
VSILGFKKNQAAISSATIEKNCKLFLFPTKGKMVAHVKNESNL